MIASEYKWILEYEEFNEYKECDTCDSLAPLSFYDGKYQCRFCYSTLIGNTIRMGKSDITGHKEAGRAKLLAQGLNAVIDEITGRKPPHPINPSTRNNDIYSSGGGRRKMITSKFLTDLGFKQQAEDRHEYRLCFATGHYLQVDIDTGLIFLIEYSDNQAVQMDRLNTDDIKLLVETFTKIWGTK